jgi:hypothetical protein
MAFWNHIAEKYTGNEPVALGTTSEPGDIKSQMIEWVGKPKWDFNIDGWNDRNKNAWTLPEALIGANPEMKERVDYLTIWADNFYYQVLLPIRQTDALTSQATRFIYSTTLAQPVAEQVLYSLFNLFNSLSISSLLSFSSWVMGLLPRRSLVAWNSMARRTCSTFAPTRWGSIARMNARDSRGDRLICPIG